MANYSVLLNLIFLTTSAWAGPAQVPSNIQLQVFKSASCGCCKSWIKHLEAVTEGTDEHSHSLWQITAQNVSDMARIKQTHNISSEYQSCHTAVTPSGYVFEGHVPAKFMQRFLNNPPANAIGLAVPGMPVGSPGMEHGEHFQPYTIQVLLKDGSHRPYASVSQPGEQF
ncbi:DUF411 domain-containing protein [Salinimonas chungwhensis]|uniref:DUF411 domain-containing protein n=1 Tax=Salinimonas chungwhensis TaxID=265425 RepID=UPI00058B4A45|nr:DUF411 domain-containing protein [Salinimonas chungwhensis]